MSRKRVTDCLFIVLRHEDQQLLDFKVDILKELNKVLQTKPHEHMQPNLLDCLVLHMIIVDEDKAKAVAESTGRSKQLHDQMNKLRKKGKLKQYKEIKIEMLNEVKQADALGVDLSKAGTYNNEIIKMILAIYFSVLKNHQSTGNEEGGVHGNKEKAVSRKGGSPLLRSVFLGIPQFTQFINMEIVFDLINVTREFLSYELEQNPKRASTFQIQNVMSALLCSFQIIEVGAGTAFNVEEKDFIDALYTVIQRLIEYPTAYSHSDFYAFIKCMHLVFVEKRQYSNEIILAFARRLATLQAYLPRAEQAGILLLLKQIIEKYSSVKSGFFEYDEDSADRGFGNNSLMYKSDVNDPSISHASQTHSFFEVLYSLNTLNYAASS